ncbi:MAG UNVERIFIED_CONTAM: aminoacyl-tRNA hydrolase [Microcystis novacekii LVE1205-3]|jgi:PTH1 family peptidyl-tRNA hydrolase
MNSDKTPNLIIPQLIIGLGNPEPKYDRTRHNIGFEAVDSLAAGIGGYLGRKTSDFKVLSPRVTVPLPGKIRLLKPQTYMNRSGQSVRLCAETGIDSTPESILVIYDDMDSAPQGSVEIRLSGSAGGHNGIKSMIAHVGTENFARLRIGIGKSTEKATISHVLGRFTPQENQVILKVLDLSRKAIRTWSQTRVTKGNESLQQSKCRDWF